MGKWDLGLGETAISETLKDHTAALPPPTPALGGEARPPPFLQALSFPSYIPLPCPRNPPRRFCCLTMYTPRGYNSFLSLLVPQLPTEPNSRAGKPGSLQGPGPAQSQKKEGRGVSSQEPGPLLCPPPFLGRMDWS